MHLDNYFAIWTRFKIRFNIGMTVYQRLIKLLEEVGEYIHAVLYGTKQQQDDECIDILITALALCEARGIHEPLHAAVMKLERTTERYLQYPDQIDKRLR